jgi:transglutaminase-like putative cysteine protease
MGVAIGILASLSVGGHALFFLPGGSRATFDFFSRWLVWLRAAFTGGRSQDPDMFLFYAALLCWTTVLFSTWAFYRRQRPLVALALPALVGAVSVFYSERGIIWVVAQLGCGVLLAALGNLRDSQIRWEAADVDYAVDLHTSVTTAAVVVALLVSFLSYFGPLLSPDEVSDWFRRTFREPTAQVEDTAERLFGGVSTPRGGLPSADREDGNASSYLPQDRLLGGRPDLLDEVVMVVRTDEPPPPPEGFTPLREFEIQLPPHYWQGLVFDHYTGRGWSATVSEREEVEGELPIPSPPSYRDVSQHFELTAPHGDTLYTMVNPARVGVSVEALWRTTPLSASLSGETDRASNRTATEIVEPDLAGLAAEIVSYTVVSRLPEPTATTLREAPQSYSAELERLYLQLPETVPDRVIELAQRVVGEGESVYGRARLLESYLRQYPYTLDVDAPPEGRDVADYFLFEAREGYCDYYATAFVVMARAVGIPARLVSGYVGGGYDHTLEAYVVRHYNGHSWPQVYFPGWGWIGFEPTGSQPIRQLREEVEFTGSGAVPRPAGPPARVIRLRWRVVAVTAIGLTLIVLLALWARPRLRRRRRVVTLPLVWYWTGRAGARVGAHPDPALTPHEYGMLVSRALRARADKTRWFHDEWVTRARRTGTAVMRLAALYSEQTYRGTRTRTFAEPSLVRAWAGLRGALRRFAWLAAMQRFWASLRGYDSDRDG